MKKPRTPTAISALLFSALACDPPAPQCEQAVSLIDVQGWRLVAPEDDPFVDGDSATFFAPDGDFDDPRPQRCTEDEVQPTELGQEPAFDIDTQRGCNWATLEQELAEPVAFGEEVKLRIFYFSQTRFAEAEAAVVLQVGDVRLVDERVPIPTSSGLIQSQRPSMSVFREGERVLWHVGNHGDNSWNFIELAKFISAPCAQDGGP